MIRALYAIGADIIRVHFKGPKTPKNTKLKPKTLFETNF